MPGIAHRYPGAGQNIEVVVVLLDVLGFEIERIVGDQNGRIWFAFDFDGAAYVDEGAAAGADVEVRFVGLEVLIFVVEDDVAARGGLVGLIVVFDVIGAQALVAIANVDGSVRDRNVALALLRSARRKLRDSTLARLTNLLGARRRYTESANAAIAIRNASSDAVRREIERGARKFRAWELQFTLNIQSVKRDQ